MMLLKQKLINFPKDNIVDFYGIDKDNYQLNKDIYGYEQHEIFLFPENEPINAKEFTIFSWNIYKQKLKEWDLVFKEALNESDIVLLQEAKQEETLVQIFETLGFSAIHAIAFKKGQQANGVMNISKTIPHFYCAQKESEPWIRFPKSGLISSYLLSNGENLMVSNFHAINFSIGLKEFTKQVNKVFMILKFHQGPIIMAGDFNTWRNGRYNIVKKRINEIGLSEVTFEKDERTRILGKTLDYMFTRGITIKESTVLNTNASDHNPLKIVMGIK